jgi:ABC-type Fe3+ transport system permease subunit
MLLVFMSALGSFSAPYIFGGGARVLATQILVSKLNGALGLAYVETTVLAVTAVLALLLLRRLEGSGSTAWRGRGARRGGCSDPASCARCCHRWRSRSSSCSCCHTRWSCS